MDSLTPQQVQKLVESSGQIHMHAFQVSLGVLTGLAFLAFIARIAIRLIYQRKLQLDDAFLILAVLCLCAATGIIYHDCYFLYLHGAALFHPELLPYLLADLEELLTFDKLVYPYLAMIWTTTFSVKWCFLAFLRPLVWHVSRTMNRFYWFVVIFCTITWAFVVSEPFIICPYFGLDALKCFTSSVDGGLTLGLTALVTVLDIVSDIMIVSIPIIILRGSNLSRSTKFGLCTFLCLSVFMAICAIIRVSGYKYHGLEDDTWEFFWQQVEGTVAVMMASVTAFRTLFVRPTDNPDISTPRSPVESFFHRLSRRFRTLAQAKPSEKPTSTSKNSMIKLPKLPSPTFTGMRTFIRRNNRTDMSAVSVDSELDPLEVDYHAALKTQNRTASRDTASGDNRPTSYDRSVSPV